MTSINETNLTKALRRQAELQQSKVSFETVWTRHLKEANPARSRGMLTRVGRAWAVGAAALVLLCSLLLSPSVRASIGGWLDIKTIKSGKNAVVYTGWASSRKWDTVTTYSSLSEAEHAIGTKIPFPQSLLDYETNAWSKEFRVTAEKGSLVGYYYTVRLKGRLISVTANYQSLTSPHFKVESAGAVAEQELTVQGVPARMFAVEEFGSRTLYLEKNDWKIVIDDLPMDDEGEASPAVSAQEVVKFAESIVWK